MKELSKFELDALKEIVHIGSSNASTALSELIKKQVTVNFPSIGSYPVEQVPSIIGGTRKIVTAVCLQLQGKKSGELIEVGSMLFIFAYDNALRIADLLQSKEPGTTQDLQAMDRDALEETGNILSGYCLKAISEFFDFSIVESLPSIATDRMGSVLDAILSKPASKAESVLVFKTDFDIEGQAVEGLFCLVLDPHVHEVLIDNIDKKYGV